MLSMPITIGITITGITIIIRGIITGTAIIITAGTTTDTIGTIVTIITGTTPTGTTGIIGTAIIITGTTIGTEPARRASCFWTWRDHRGLAPLRVIVLPDLSLETASDSVQVEPAQG
jgi:ABC-type dipeptide/oligopeptide/nickel transport system permease component